MKRKQPLTFKEFKSIYSKVPRLCVDLVIPTNKGILLTLRQENGYVGQWHFPGGTVYFRETLENAVYRVAREELGIEVRIIKFLNYMEFFSELKERGFGYTISLAFLCKPINSNFKLNEQASKIDFFKSPPENTVKEQKKLLEELRFYVK